MGRLAISLVWLALPVAFAQQPGIFLRGVVNAASYTPSGLPGGAIGRGGIFSIFGRGIGPLTAAQVAAFPLENTFNGVSLRVTQGARSVNAIPIFVSAAQVNAIMPSNAPLGAASLRISFNGRESGPVPVFIADNALGIFTATGAGAGPAIVQNFISQTEQPLNTTAKTARPGQVVILWLTGLGPIMAADNVAPPVGDLPVAVEIFVGGRRVTSKLYSGRSPCCSGVDQVIFQVPADAPSGCFVPVIVKVGSRISNTVTMAIHPEGQVCSDPDNPYAAPFLAGQRVGVIELTRLSLFLDFNVFQISRPALELASAYFRRERGGELAFNPNFAQPPAGSCTAYTASGFLLGGIANRLASPFRGLTTGPVTLTTAAGDRTLMPARMGRGFYYNPIALSPSTQVTGPVEQPGFLAPGAVQVRSPGGADLGALQGSATLQAPMVWTNRDRLTTIDRAQGARFEWTATANGRVVVGGVAYDVPTNSSAMFLCVAPAGASSFEVPAEFLANLPAARRQRHQSVGVLLFASLPAGLPSPIPVNGVDYAAVLQKAIAFKSVRFR